MFSDLGSAGECRCLGEVEDLTLAQPGQGHPRDSWCQLDDFVSVVVGEVPTVRGERTAPDDAGYGSLAQQPTVATPNADGLR